MRRLRQHNKTVAVRSALDSCLSFRDRALFRSAQGDCLRESNYWPAAFAWNRLSCLSSGVCGMILR